MRSDRGLAVRQDRSLDKGGGVQEIILSDTYGVYKRVISAVNKEASERWSCKYTWRVSFTSWGIGAMRLMEVLTEDIANGMSEKRGLVGWFSLPGREKFCLGEINFGEILPGKNSVPKLKNGEKFCPLGVWKRKNKGNTARSAEEIFGFFFVDDKMKLSFP
jgi:hypothetical protein